MTKHVVSYLLLFLCMLQPASLVQAETSKHRVALVIDDLGNNMKGTDEILALPIPLTVAVMPFLSTTKEDAIRAHKSGKQIIIHLPMEPKSGKQSWLGPNPITTNLSDEEIRKRVTAAIKSVPHAVGMNNHMGSKATADERVMRIVLQVCKEHRLFFLDSHTNYRSVVGKVAIELGVPYIENQLFLDDIPSYSHVSRQMELLLTKSRNMDKIIAIGHVGRSGMYTSSVLKQYIPRLQETTHPCFVSELLHTKKRTKNVSSS
ncbi:divergent polysaccharide deacetylase family protein [Priestia taiwanensis]|uniref:Divergent polysaccharide deacetylase n=1 Tax=Priestia taiwanensis TaxID=1347902 RepID=A0A917ASK7_9BACI|nr:divergent polysaccharide deacetylase family protein [Priestia taiwanensis]MBM7364012.1 polysaccharide deacetylase 2 family uncharacterized protein YibQ [Priestia taiwanensis]GGE70962.1 hypothetical protein GCM10007140_21020 [Priestia taiwanensis]